MTANEINMYIKHKRWAAAFCLLVLLVCIPGTAACARIYRVSIPTYNQHKAGYPRGCEGVSLYMALKGKGYLKGISLKSFMKTMPTSKSNPKYGFVGDPTKSASAAVNRGKRTTIYPCALAKWGRQYGEVESLKGKSTTVLKKELQYKDKEISDK